MAAAPPAGRSGAGTRGRGAGTGLGRGRDGTSMGLGRGFGGAAPELRARGHGHLVCPSTHHSIVPSLCQCLTLPLPTLGSTCHPITAAPAGRCDLDPKLPRTQPQRFTLGRPRRAAHLTSKPGTSFCCPPAPAVSWCSAPHPSHHCLHSPLPSGSWGPLTTLRHHLPVQSSMGCTSHSPGPRPGFGSLLPGILICIEGHSPHTLLDLHTQVSSSVAPLKQTPTH